MKMPASLFSLTVAAFAIGTTEFIVVGLLPGIAQDFGTSVSTAGLLVSCYALAVVLIAPLVTALSAGLPRKTLMLGLMSVFLLGNIIGAFASGYAVLLVSRIVLGIIHGVFLGTGATVASSLVSKEKSAQAISLMFAGVTVAMVFGVPLGTWLGEAFGWRAPFLVVTAFGAISVLAMAMLLPKNLTYDKPAGFWAQLAVLKDRQLVMMYLITAFGFGGTFVVFTYISPMLTQVTGYPESAVSWILMVFGVATVIGNLAGGWISDRLSPLRALKWVLPGLVLSLLTITWTAHSPWMMALNVFVWGVFAFLNVPIVQAGVVSIAEKRLPGSQGVASGLNIAAFNVGIAVASFVGGSLIDSAGIMVTPWVGALITAAGIGLVFILSGMAGKGESGADPEHRTSAGENESLVSSKAV